MGVGEANLKHIVIILLAKPNHHIREDILVIPDSQVHKDMMYYWLKL